MAMFNKWTAITIILALVLSLGNLFLPAHKASATGLDNVYVNAIGNDSNDGSTPTDEGGGVGPVATIARGFGLVASDGTVYVAAGTYKEHGLFFDNKTCFLSGAGAASTIIDGENIGNGVIQINDCNVTISDFTIQHGNNTGGTGGISITGNGIATLINCWIKDNQGRNGGGIGIGTSCVLQMSGCTVSGNSSPDYGGGPLGGYGGGGIYNTDGTAWLTNCTISNNTSTATNGYGGGIYNSHSVAGGNMTLTNCTIAFNSATGNPGYGHGGGFYNTYLGTMTFLNTIVAGNTAIVGYNADNHGTVNSLGDNLDSLNECGFNQTTDQHDVDPLLGTLAPNGGPTPTCAIGEGSQAIDNACCHSICASAPTTDQRGIARPQGCGCDIGAYERAVPPTIYSVSLNWGCRGQTADFLITGLNLFGVNGVDFGSGINSSNFTVDSCVHITAHLVIDPAATLGYRDVTVSSLGGDDTLVQGFVVNVAAPLTTVYVNSAIGDDNWDGASVTYDGGTTGPKLTIGSAYLALSDNGTINLAAGTYEQPGILFTKSLTLSGAGSFYTIIDAGNTGPVIVVVGSTAHISDLTIQHGTGTIYAGGLTLTDSATATVNDCVIKDCIGRNGGGVGLDPSCTLNMTGCTISGNTPLTTDESGGGGILNNGGTIYLTNCTIDGNFISDSAPHGFGAGIGNYGTMTLTDCTISHNANNSLDPGQGGGFYNATGSTMTFQNTIVARNVATYYNNGYNNGGTIVTLGNNMTSEGDFGFIGPPAGTDFLNTDPLIFDTLEDNGGPTPTIALSENSTAIDHGACVTGVTTDQRGIARPQGSGCDIGAYEFLPEPTVSSVNPNSGYMGQTLSGVVITGNYLTYNTYIGFGDGITVTHHNVDSDTQITANISIDAFTSAGTRDVTVTTLGGTDTLTSGFTVTTSAVPPKPTLKAPAGGATVSTVTPRLEWNAVTGPAKYDLQVATSYTFSTASLLVNADDITGLYYDIPGGPLNWSKTYYWHVRAYNGGGNSAWSAYRSFKTSVGPPPDFAPSNLVATAITSTRIQLDWQDNSSNETSFKIERKTGAGGTYAVVGTVTAGVTSFTNGSRVPNTTYFYRVRAHNAGGNSGYSNEVSAMTFPAPTKNSPAAGATVSTLTPRLEWDALIGATSYGLQVATSYNFTPASLLVNTDNITGLYYDITGGLLNWSKTYYWRVRAHKGGDTSSWSAYRSFKTSVGPPPDFAPSNLVAMAITSTRIQLDWQDNSSNETSFKIERKTGAGGTYAVVGTVIAGVTTFTNGDRVPNTTYFYRVRAHNAGGNSGYSNEVSATPLRAPTLSSPAGGATVPSLTPTLAWNVVTNANTYSVQVATTSAFTSVVVSADNITELHYDITSGLDWAKTYYWHVSAQNSGGTSSWSAYRSFKTPAGP